LTVTPATLTATGAQCNLARNVVAGRTSAVRNHQHVLDLGRIDARARERCLNAWHRASRRA